MVHVCFHLISAPGVIVAIEIQTNNVYSSLKVVNGIVE